MLSTRMKNYHIKAYSYQIKKWKAYARILGMSTSQLVRETLDSVVMETLRPNFHKAEMVRGCDPDREEIAESFQFRVTTWESAEWTQCADSEGLSVGEWCRQSLDYMVESKSMVDLRKVI